jgi:hypothetical protein
MRLSGGWRELILFWVGIAALGGIGAGILQSIGPPAPIDNSAQDESVPMALSAAAEVAAFETPSDVDAASLQPTREETPDAAPFDSWTVVPYLRMPMAVDGGSETGTGTRQAAPRPEQTWLLRITRDHKLCPKVVCYKWQLVTQRAKLPLGATIDLAKLRLAPSLREATEKGKVDLIINATERRKPASGGGNVVFVATSLYGVTPHDETP